MRTSIYQLMQAVPPPLGPIHPVQPDDYSHYNLSVSVDVHLVDLLRIYGQGTFRCDDGDSITIHLPTKSNTLDCEDICDGFKSALSSGLIEADNCIPSEWLFGGDAKLRRVDLVLWATSANGVLFFSIWLGHGPGWATMLVDGRLPHAACFFKSPAALLYDIIFRSSVVAGMFPEFSEPYRFEPHN